MPAAEPAILAQREALLAELRALLPAPRVIADAAGLRAYACDALTAYRQMPLVAVLPDTVAELAGVLAICHRRNIKVVARGAGTSLSGGALPLADAVLIGLGRFNRILDIDYANRCLTAQSGVTNLALSEAVAARNFY
ncbi:MAG: FAD-binding protein, partial [Porticoccaceae bacterium]